MSYLTDYDTAHPLHLAYARIPSGSRFIDVAYDGEYYRVWNVGIIDYLGD